MGRDHQPKHVQKARDLRRRAAVRQAYERLLIVCEGEKTEPQYLSEICREMRLATAHVHVRQGGLVCTLLTLKEQLSAPSRVPPGRSD